LHGLFNRASIRATKALPSPKRHALAFYQASIRATKALLLPKKLGRALFFLGRAKFTLSKKKDAFAVF